MSTASKPMMLLVNPYAGRSTNNNILGSTVDAFCRAGFAPAVYYTDAPGSARTLAAQVGSQYPRLVCMGGDGTLSDVVAGLMTIEPDERPKLGYIPMGTANDVANTLGLPMRQPVKAVEKILAGRPLDYDVGEMEGIGFFTYIAAFGAFTEVSYKTDQDLKKALGHIAYVIEAVTSLPSIKSYHAVLEHDTGVLEGRFIYGAVSNAISVGGVMKMDPSLVDLSDGKFEVLLVSEPASAGDLNSIVSGILARDYSSSPCLHVVQSSRVSFTFEEAVPWTRDGEDGGSHLTLDLRCHRHGVKIYR